MKEPLHDATSPSRVINERAAGHVYGWLSRKGPKLAGVMLWAALLVAYWGYSSRSGLGPRQVVELIINFVADSPLGVLIYILAYIVRPVLFFPATLLTAAAGYLYGPFLGVPLVLLASNLSSMIAYLAGRFLGGEIVHRAAAGTTLHRYAEQLRRNSFETVLTLRFLFLPYDLVSVVSGFLRVGWQGFWWATLVGSIPGSITFILFGAAIEGRFDGALPGINLPMLGGAAVMFGLSLGLSRWLRRRAAVRRTKDPGEENPPTAQEPFRMSS